MGGGLGLRGRDLASAGCDGAGPEQAVRAAMTATVAAAVAALAAVAAVAVGSVGRGMRTGRTVTSVKRPWPAGRQAGNRDRHLPA